MRRILSSRIGENRRKRGSGFSCSELQKTMARSSLEGIPQPLSKFGVEARRVSTFDYCEAAVRRQGRSNRD